MRKCVEPRGHGPQEEVGGAQLSPLRLPPSGHCISKHFHWHFKHVHIDTHTAKHTHSHRSDSALSYQGWDTVGCLFVCLFCLFPPPAAAEHRVTHRVTLRMTTTRRRVRRGELKHCTIKTHHTEMIVFGSRPYSSLHPTTDEPLHQDWCESVTQRPKASIIPQRDYIPLLPSHSHSHPHQNITASSWLKVFFWHSFTAAQMRFNYRRTFRVHF